jgi:hypothetical protein
MKIHALKKLYSPFILPVGTICSFFYAIAASDSRNIHTGVSFALLVIGVVLMLIEIWKDQAKSHKEEMKRLRERHDSSSPRWDGVVRSDNDLEPRMRILENRILKDTYELQRIKLELEYKSYKESRTTP